MAGRDDAGGQAQRWREAMNALTPSWRLAALADDSDAEVRLAVAENPGASATTMVRLLRDPDGRVRTAASAREGISA